MIVLLLLAAPFEPALAYIDPNSAGPLYQIFFPLLVAIGSFVVGFRRAISRLWHRLTGPFAREISDEKPAKSDGDWSA
jgi:hypothetical protein